MITVRPNGTFVLLGVQYSRNPVTWRYQRQGKPWPHSVVVADTDRLNGPYRCMMVPTDRLRLVHADWLDAPAIIDGELSMIMADMIMDDIEEIVEHPLNRHRAKAFRKDAEALARWFAKRSRNPANNRVV